MIRGAIKEQKNGPCLHVFVLTPSSRLTALLAEQNKKRLRLIMYAIDNQQHTITTTETKTGTDKAAYGVRL